MRSSFEDASSPSSDRADTAVAQVSRHRKIGSGCVPAAPLIVGFFRLGHWSTLMGATQARHIRWATNAHERLGGVAAAGCGYAFNKVAFGFSPLDTDIDVLGRQVSQGKLLWWFRFECWTFNA